MEATSYTGIVPHGKTSTTTIQPIQLDRSTYALMTIDNAHHEIHSGSHYFFQGKHEIASAGVIVYLITTPDTDKYAHFVYTADGSAITQIDLYEGADRTGTTAQTIFNSDRNSANVSGLVIHLGISSGTTDGTLIKTYKGGSASALSRVGPTTRGESELILKRNTKYLLRFTSGTNNNLCNVKFEWYEHTDKTA